MKRSDSTLPKKESYIPPAVEMVVFLPERPLLQEGSADGEDAGDEYYFGY